MTATTSEDKAQDSASHLLITDALSRSVFANMPYLIYVLLLLLVIVIFASRKYFRRRYPCRTASDVKKKETSLEKTFRLCIGAQDRPFYAHKLQELKLRQIRLNVRAREIVIESLELQRTWWSVCEHWMGILPPILYKIITWHEDAEALELDIKAFHERIARDEYCGKLTPPQSIASGTTWSKALA
ncbi:hypothetical protein Moror_10397 [Moniliophthora roreri MCA 2997]|uniref:Uncharacterized protein n=2 Tax=Moniliophthora roreri TaxID=221103 RepID=V2XGK5_MONRO|nr:hypothetical protein Moror_10397 [Moniliophthora roreri MCA 2997]KAI3601320.1 hypothetical protein WG66_013339 [Moniliophthora roreri]